MKFVLLFGIIALSCLSSVCMSFALENISPFEKRIQNQISNKSINSSFANDVSILELPRNRTIDQILLNNQTTNELSNVSTTNMVTSTITAKQNISDTLSLLN